jgi:hypothetical protein
MELSPKAIRFLIEALKNYREHFEHRLEEDSLSEDESADISNDHRYLLALEQSLLIHHDELLKAGMSLSK